MGSAPATLPTVLLMELSVWATTPHCTDRSSPLTAGGAVPAGPCLCPVVAQTLAARHHLLPLFPSQWVHLCLTVRLVHNGLACDQSAVRDHL